MGEPRLRDALGRCLVIALSLSSIAIRVHRAIRDRPAPPLSCAACPASLELGLTSNITALGLEMPEPDRAIALLRFTHADDLTPCAPCAKVMHPGSSVRSSTAFSRELSHAQLHAVMRGTHDLAVEHRVREIGVTLFGNHPRRDPDPILRIAKSANGSAICEAEKPAPKSPVKTILERCVDVLSMAELALVISIFGF